MHAIEEARILSRNYSHPVVNLEITIILRLPGGRIFEANRPMQELSLKSGSARCLIYSHAIIILTLFQPSQTPSPDSSSVFIPELPAEIKYPPSIQPRPPSHERPGHYVQIAHNLGAERRTCRSHNNPYVASYNARFKKGKSPPTSPNPYVESLHKKLTSSIDPVEPMETAPIASAVFASQPNSYVESLHTKLSPATKHRVTRVSNKPRGDSDKQTTEKHPNSYVESLHTKLSPATKHRVNSEPTCKGDSDKQSTKKLPNSYVESLHTKLLSPATKHRVTRVNSEPKGDSDKKDTKQGVNSEPKADSDKQSTKKHPNSYVESLHSKLLSPPTNRVTRVNSEPKGVSDKKTEKLPNSYVESLHAKLLAPAKSLPEGSQTTRAQKDSVERGTRYRNEYVEGLHAKLSGRRCGHKHRDKKRKLINKKVHADTCVHTCTVIYACTCIVEK